MSNKLLVTGGKGSLISYNVKIESSTTWDEEMMPDEIEKYINADLVLFCDLAYKELGGYELTKVGNDEQNKTFNRLEHTITYLTDLIEFEIIISGLIEFEIIISGNGGNYKIPQFVAHSISRESARLINEEFRRKHGFDLFALAETDAPILVIGLPEIGVNYGITQSIPSTSITVTVIVPDINKRCDFNFNGVYLIGERFFNRLAHDAMGKSKSTGEDYSREDQGRDNTFLDHFDDESCNGDYWLPGDEIWPY